MTNYQLQTEQKRKNQTPVKIAKIDENQFYSSKNQDLAEIIQKKSTKPIKKTFTPQNVV